MIKHAYNQGAAEALNSLGLIPPESLAQVGLLANLASNPNSAMGLNIGDYSLPAAPEPDSGTETLLHRIRKLAPLLGGIVGTGIGLTTHSDSPALHKAVKGFLGGAGVGSIPNVLMGGHEALLGAPENS